jgi:hypothetical protein
MGARGGGQKKESVFFGEETTKKRVAAFLLLWIPERDLERSASSGLLDPGSHPLARPPRRRPEQDYTVVEANINLLKGEQIISLIISDMSR